MARSITGATAVFQLAIAGLYNSPQQLQGYAADDIFSTPAVASVETMMGADGLMSAGFVYTEKKMSIALQADSDSNTIFETWNDAMQSEEDIFYANGIVMMKALQQKWTLTRGVLTSFSAFPDVKKLIQPRKYEITWNIISAAPV